MSSLVHLIFFMLMSVALAGCQQEGPMERAGKAVDEAVEGTGEAIEDAQENVEAAIQDRKDKK